MSKIQKELDDFINEFKDNLSATEELLITKYEEDEQIEFKKSVHYANNCLSKDYIQTITAFANNKGGKIIFGIDPDTKELLGVKPDTLDNVLLATLLNTCTEGGIEAFIKVKKISGKNIAFLIIKEAIEKPIIISSSNSDFKEGDIYYRYAAQTRRISVNDLRTIINGEKNKILSHFMEKINLIGQIGVDKSSILNIDNGELHNLGNSKLIMDKEILDQLNLIKEGKIVEKEGASAYIIKGEISAENIQVATTKTVSRPTIIGITDILRSYISNDTTYSSDYLKSFIYQQTIYLPIYYFMKSSNLNIANTIKLLRDKKGGDVKVSVQTDLIKRLSKKEKFLPLSNIKPDLKYSSEIVLDNLKPAEIRAIIKNNSLPKNNEKIVIRTLIYNQLLKKTLLSEQFVIKYANEVINAISNLSSKFIIDNEQYIKSLFEIIFNEYEKGELNSTTKSLLKKIICHTDFVINYPN